MSMEEADGRFDECLDVLLKAWTSDAPFSYRGRYWEFDDIVVEPPPTQKPHPQVWMGAGSERSIRQVAARGYASLTSVASHIDAYRSEVEARGRRFDPMHVGVTRALFVTDAAEERQAALERRLQNRVRQLKLATWPDGTVLGGPDRATGDPRTINENSAMYGSPDDIAKRLEELRDAGVGYVLAEVDDRTLVVGASTRLARRLCP
jgi:alkanesulfonate monooxygenase SsuD/methylene tetrahydromethanopterin reductase-like flavin-dependent oxidoreductase (luciferase family)